MFVQPPGQATIIPWYYRNVDSLIATGSDAEPTFSVTLALILVSVNLFEPTTSKAQWLITKVAGQK